jgi:anti-sigma factor RsiW
MCDFSEKLIAWLDGELPTDEASRVERHLKGCSECRSSLDAYKRMSAGFDAYCDAAVSFGAPCGVARWVPVISGAGAVAALVALLLAMPRTHVAPPTFHAPEAAAVAQSVAVAAQTPTSLVQEIPRRHARAPASVRDTNPVQAQNQNGYLLSEEPVIQIAISADEMFPPGAVPEGMHFVADLTIAADGSAERLQLRPRLAGFERRTTQP